MVKFLLSLGFLFFGTFTNLSALTQFSIADSEMRLESAQSYLSGNPSHMAFYSKGLVCSSCAIGLRIHIREIDGIDRNKLDDGMLLDAKNQLLIIAFLQGFVPNIQKIITAIDNAGYETTHYYHNVDGIVQIKAIQEKFW